ncbi:MAG: helix-turn-helix transcriptional regulator [Clostridia bacterium]|nr:helix-turn-helix transcriptional regulator [Clostridia bacterium]
MLYHIKIRELREDNDVSQHEIADFIGIDRVTYNRLENEKFSIKLDLH